MNLVGLRSMCSVPTSVESAYAWASDPQATGRMNLTVREGLIVRLVVTFD